MPKASRKSYWAQQMERAKIAETRMVSLHTTPFIRIRRLLPQNSLFPFVIPSLSGACRGKKLEQQEQHWRHCPRKALLPYKSTRVNPMSWLDEGTSWRNPIIRSSVKGPGSEMEEFIWSVKNLCHLDSHVHPCGSQNSNRPTQDCKISFARFKTKKRCLFCPSELARKVQGRRTRLQQQTFQA